MALITSPSSGKAQISQNGELRLSPSPRAARFIIHEPSSVAKLAPNANPLVPRIWRAQKACERSPQVATTRGGSGRAVPGGTPINPFPACCRAGTPLQRWESPPCTNAPFPWTAEKCHRGMPGAVGWHPALARPALLFWLPSPVWPAPEPLLIHKEGLLCSLLSTGLSHCYSYGPSSAGHTCLFFQLLSIAVRFLCHLNKNNEKSPALALRGGSHGPSRLRKLPAPLGLVLCRQNSLLGGLPSAQLSLFLVFTLKSAVFVVARG